MATSAIFGELDDEDSSDLRAKAPIRPVKVVRVTHPTETKDKDPPVQVSPTKVTVRQKILTLKPPESEDFFSFASNVVELDRDQIALLKAKLETRTKEIETYFLEEVVLDLLASRQALETAVVIVKDGLGKEISAVQTDYLTILETAKTLQLVNHLLEGHDGLWKNEYLTALSRLYADRVHSKTKSGALPTDEVTRRIGMLRKLSQRLKSKDTPSA